jgi:6-phosphogluconolactonase
MNNKNKIRVFRSAEAMNECAAQLIIELADKAVMARGRFVLALSGGKTPNGLYSLLSDKPYHDRVPWKDTFVFWSDERCVPSADEQNNAYMATSGLLSKVDIPRSQIYPVPVGLPPAEAAICYEQTLKDFFGAGDPQFDLILLGLGENGHTASLFPGTDVLTETEHWVKEVFVEFLHMYRITMTANFINQARNIVFLVTGREKSDILNTVLMGPLRPELYPAQLIRPEHGTLTWYLDEPAASKLPG